MTAAWHCESCGSESGRFPDPGMPEHLCLRCYCAQASAVPCAPGEHRMDQRDMCVKCGRNSVGIADWDDWIVGRVRWKTVMVDTVIASQVASGGVDTEGTRAEAERWLAHVCMCACEGLRATTDASAHRLTGGDAIWGLNTGPVRLLGKPLGRP